MSLTTLTLIISIVSILTLTIYFIQVYFNLMDDYTNLEEDSSEDATKIEDN